MNFRLCLSPRDEVNFALCLWAAGGVTFSMRPFSVRISQGLTDVHFHVERGHGPIHNFRSGPGAYPQGPLPWSGCKTPSVRSSLLQLPQYGIIWLGWKRAAFGMELPFVFEIVI